MATRNENAKEIRDYLKDMLEEEEEDFE